MNFLSHFYNEQPCSDPYVTVGIILPDILSNYSFRTGDLAKVHPRKLEQTDDPLLLRLATGIQKHYALDEAFHGSAFFRENTHFISEVLNNYAFACFPKRKYAFAHVLLEIMLDRKVLHEEIDCCDRLYALIGEIDSGKLEIFLRNNSKVHNTGAVVEHFNRFRAHRFLYDYADDVRLTGLVDIINRRLGNPAFNDIDRLQFKPVIHDIEIALFSQKFPKFPSDS